DATMPARDTAAANVDYVLSTRELAWQLARIVRHPYARADDQTDKVLREKGDVVNEIIDLLRAHTAVDFTHYKRTTIGRRIQRRVALKGFESVEDYLHFLRDNPLEQQQLYQDLLIRVTQFFRDPELFEALKEKVFPEITRGRTPESPVRIWVAGCATGEEVYSLAISLLEYLAGRPDVVPIKILATDLNEAALEKARAGVYIDNIELDVSQERLRRYFVWVNGRYQISKAVRDLCVFSRHNMVTDPPFSRLDLISCRNVLIYLDAALQRRVLPVFHYALSPGGFLVLGTSENVSGSGELFTVTDAKNKIYKKSVSHGSLPIDFSSYVSAAVEVPRAVREAGAPLWSALDVQKEADRIVLARFAPVGVVIDEAMTVLQFRGRTAAYLEPAPGMASLDLLKMLREGLLTEVRS